jgi:hypothetical protein
MDRSSVEARTCSEAFPSRSSPSLHTETVSTQRSKPESHRSTGTSPAVTEMHHCFRTLLVRYQSLLLCPPKMRWAWHEVAWRVVQLDRDKRPGPRIPTHSAFLTSSATRLPERTAPSMYPHCIMNALLSRDSSGQPALFPAQNADPFIVSPPVYVDRAR